MMNQSINSQISSTTDALIIKASVMLFMIYNYKTNEVRISKYDDPSTPNERLLRYGLDVEKYPYAFDEFKAKAEFLDGHSIISFGHPPMSGPLRMGPHKVIDINWYRNLETEEI